MSSFEEELKKRPWAKGVAAEVPEEEYAEDESADDYYADDSEEYAEEPEPEEVPKKKLKKGKTRKRRRRRRSHPFLALLLFVVLVVGIIMALKSSLFAIKDIQVVGNRYYTPSQIIEMSGIESGKNLIFELKPRDARNRLLQTPYIRVASVDRVPLSTVRITVEERLEYAAVNYQEQFIIIDREGTVLRIAEEPPAITVMEGIEIKQMEEGKPIKAEQTYLLTETLRLLNATDQMDLYFKRVYFSTAVVRAYIYDNYYCEGAPENILGSLGPIKELAEQHFAQGVNKGVIKVGTDGYLSFNPKID